MYNYARISASLIKSWRAGPGQVGWSPGLSGSVAVDGRTTSESAGRAVGPRGGAKRPPDVVRVKSHVRAKAAAIAGHGLAWPPQFPFCQARISKHHYSLRHHLFLHT